MQIFKLFLLLQSITLFHLVHGACETEDDLDFEKCNLIDLSDRVLTGICNRIGLDMIEHVLPTIVDDDDEDNNNNNSNGAGEEGTKVYTHEQYAMGAEECIMVEAEMERLAVEDPEELERMEREAMAEDPDILAEIIADVLEQDEKLLTDVASKIKDATIHADIVKDIVEGMLNEGEKLEDRPDVLGYLVATIMVEDPDFLDEFDDQLAEEFFHYDSEDWEESDETMGDEL
eukprot:CAMPEP_0201698114 /NCGR_PEP_ID=MMETSP0578-20130828/17248_1 /ASSEMBLY_ACC=CAM_ASM_000663 /TAXON_ID=267565 /ORGANISM="Skeletonema grethea, Strain CCMP 1804" /LENGTH=230 /DNA_ID=CAMNT_0048184557 /DNA_START=12 /DNA_END=704 /DNA_ORIENTATION=-